MGIENLEPKECFKWFGELAKIPRGSHNEKQVSDFLVQFAKDRGLPVTQDELFNVFITKPGCLGLENAAPVIVQGHMDMVCVKEEGLDFDFEKDPIKILVEGDFVTADRTTLGADNGIAVAFALALLDSKDIPHPPLEALFTAQEETGMGGAAAFDASPLKGRYFINIDSEDEGIFCVSCAGGRRSQMTIPLETVAVSSIAGNDAYRFVTVGVSGLQGGHSGMDIHRERGNSNRLLGRTLAACAEKFDIHLVSVKGGSAMNVLPAESSAVIFTNAPEAALKAELAHWEAIFKNELKASDGAGLVLALKDAPVADTVLSAATLKKLLTALTLIPHGVQSMDLNMKDQTLVESSNNLAVLVTDAKGIHISCASRSSVGSRKVFIYEQIKAVADAIGAELTYSGDYPAWEYNPESKLRDTFRAAYKSLFGKDATVEGIHAGLECGLFSEKFKELGHDVDFVAFGPNISGAHSVNEKVSRSSVENMWKLLKEVLKTLGK